jgi:hypothetical protein
VTRDGARWEGFGAINGQVGQAKDPTLVHNNTQTPRTTSQKRCRSAVAGGVTFTPRQWIRSTLSVEEVQGSLQKRDQTRARASWPKSYIKSRLSCRGLAARARHRPSIEIAWTRLGSDERRVLRRQPLVVAAVQLRRLAFVMNHVDRQFKNLECHKKSWPLPRLHLAVVVLLHQKIARNQRRVPLNTPTHHMKTGH